MTSRTRLKRKEVDDVLGGAEAWAHADKTQGTLSLPSISFGGADLKNEISIMR